LSKILVVTPTLERPTMCARAVRSLLRQDFAAWELVIAKNGGGDHLADYVAALGDVLGNPRVRMVILPERGLGYALNQALDPFLGETHEFFAILEDDDEWHPDFLRQMYRAARATCADVVHCLQRQVPSRRQSDGGPMDGQKIRRFNWINFPMCLFRASLFDRAGGFSEEAGPATDWDWHLRCLRAGARYHFVPRVLVTHHWHGNNYCLLEDGAPRVLRWIQEGRYD